MEYTKKQVSNIIAEAIIKEYGKSGSMLDGNNILWRIVDDKWIGKRSVWTIDNSSCWLEHTKIENIKSWWCGKEADYNEIFYRE